MAEKRMFNKKIIDSDLFLDMSLSTQALYFHLAMRADDDGFVDNPKKIMRMVGASQDELKLLIFRQFLLGFDTGVIVIRHWKLHNTIQKDRYKQSIHTFEKSCIDVSENKIYQLLEDKKKPKISMSEIKQIGSNVVTNSIQDGDVDKIRLDKISIDNNIVHSDEMDMFEQLWILYPRKEGKSRIIKSKSKLKELYKIGYEEMKRTIERYKKTISGVDKKYIKMGSTFFTTDYKDFLDKNYNEKDYEIKISAIDKQKDNNKTIDVPDFLQNLF